MSQIIFFSVFSSGTPEVSRNAQVPLFEKCTKYPYVMIDLHQMSLMMNGVRISLVHLYTFAHSYNITSATHINLEILSLTTISPHLHSHIFSIPQHLYNNGDTLSPPHLDSHISTNPQHTFNNSDTLSPPHLHSHISSDPPTSL